jgi:hypothetical protein
VTIEQMALDFEVSAGPNPPKKTRLSGAKDETRRSIGEMIDLAIELGYASDIGDLIDQASAVRGHRLFNSLLAVLQRPRAKWMLSRQEWLRTWQRTVRPDAQPLVLLLNWGPVQFLFDVSQTESLPGAPNLPLGLDNPYSMEHAKGSDFALGWAIANAKHDGIRVLEAQRGFSSAGCIRSPRSKATVIAEWPDGRSAPQRLDVRFELMLNATYNATEKLATIAHELGHLYCGHLDALKNDWWPSRTGLDETQREFEAESVARLAFRRIAPKAQLPDHLAQYFESGAPLPTNGWDVVIAAADRVVDMCQGFSPMKSK